MNGKATDRFRLRFFAASLGLLAFYGLGLLFPERFWATNSPGILPMPAQIALFAVVGTLFSMPFWWKWEAKQGGNPDQLNRAQRNLGFLLLSLLMAFLYSQFPIFRDLYGDSFYIRQAVDLEIPNWDNRLISEFFEPDWLSSKVGLRTWYQVNNLLTWLTGMNGVEVARITGFVVGGMWCFLWMKFVDMHLPGLRWKLLFIAVGLTAPFTLVFMGHFETYSFSYTGIMIWFTALGIYFKTENRRWLLALPLVFLIVLQTHITNWLLFPSLLLVFAWRYRHRKAPGWVAWLDGQIRSRFPAYKGGMTWSGLLVYYFVPVILLGAVTYFFIFANHDGPRKFTKEEFENTLFLPLYTDEPAPYDRYNLFSPSHFSDYLNLMYMWSSAALLLLVPPLTFLRKKVPWNEPLVLISGSTALLLFVVFFVLNPLLSPGVDWDLFVAPGLIVLPFLVIVYAHLARHIRLRTVAGPVLGLCLLGGTFLVVNTSRNMLSEKLGYLGRWSFKTYWIGTSTLLNASAELSENPAEEEKKRLAILRDLEAHAIKGNDSEYAGLLLSEGIFQGKEKGNNREALAHFEKAYIYSPRLGRNLYFLVVTHFDEGHYADAHRYVQELVEMKYPPFAKTLKIGIHVSLAAKEYQSAANFAVTYLNRWQDDPVVAEVERRLRTGDRIERLIDLFGVTE